MSPLQEQTTPSVGVVKILFIRIRGANDADVVNRVDMARWEPDMARFLDRSINSA
jgi:hypothetical protein